MPGPQRINKLHDDRPCQQAATTSNTTTTLIDVAKMREKGEREREGESIVATALVSANSEHNDRQRSNQALGEEYTRKMWSVKG